MNCLSCSSFMDCNNPFKSGSFKCDLFKLYAPTVEDYSAIVGKDIVVDRPILASNFVPTASSEINLIGMLDSLDSESGVPPDLRVDDRDMVEFKNFYEYIYNDSYPSSIKPFARQMHIILKLFADYCPKCTPKRSNWMESIYNVPIDADSRGFVDKVQLLENGVCPCCGSTRSGMHSRGEMNVYRELALCCGQRMGKSFVLALISSYAVHKYLKLQKITEVFPGIASNTTLTGTFIGLRFDDAVALLWNPFKDILTSNPWFVEYNRLMSHYNNKLGEEQFKVMDTYIKYGYRNLFFHPSGPNKRTLRGRTRILCGIDEIGWFDSDEGSDSKERTSASEVYTVMESSLGTLAVAHEMLIKRGVNNVLPPLFLNISSPSEQKDKIMSLIRESTNSRVILGFHNATWEINPLFSRESSFIEKKYNADPIKAERDFGANPPLTNSPFFERPSILGESFHKYKNGIDYEYKHGKNNAGDNLRAGVITRINTDGTNLPPSVLAIDAGYSNNSFSLVVANIDKPGTLKFSVLCEIIPKVNHYKLSHARIVSDLIHKIIDSMNIVAVFADRWQSILLLHQLEEKYSKLLVEKYSVKYSDFVDYKSYLEGGSILLPALSDKSTELDKKVYSETYPNCFDLNPVDHLYHQLKTVKDTGKTVTKGGGYTDDLVRASVLATAKLLDAKFAEKYLKVSASKSQTRAMGTVMSRGHISSGTRTSSVGSLISRR